MNLYGIDFPTGQGGNGQRQRPSLAKRMGLSLQRHLYERNTKVENSHRGHGHPIDWKPIGLALWPAGGSLLLMEGLAIYCPEFANWYDQ
jgi:hypothetical protein